MIKLSKLTDYAVVVLSELARGKGAVLSASELSERSGLPEPTVAKILKLLAKSDLVTSIRGMNGGYSLQKGAEEIDMASIITAMDGPIALTSCVEGSDACCSHEEVCPIKGQWNPVNAAMRDALAKVSLAEMIGVRS